MDSTLSSIRIVNVVKASVILAVSLLASVIPVDSVQAQSTSSIGVRECGPYEEQDERFPDSFAETDIRSASVDTFGDGYVLTLVLDDEEQPRELSFDSDLELVVEVGSSYGSMEIENDYRFQVAIFSRSFWCSYSGVAEISDEALSKLSGSTAEQSPANHSQNSVSIRVPEDSSKSCQEAIDLVEVELIEKGFFSPWNGDIGGRRIQIEPEINIYADDIQSTYYNYPATRPHTISFELSGEFNKIDTLLISPQLMSILGAQIMADCYQVGLVRFNHWWEGGVPIGYFVDNTARPFIPVTIGRADGFISDEQIETRRIETEHGPRQIFPWGYYHYL